MSKREPQPLVDSHFSLWKPLIPVLYDWFTNHNLLWPSLSCRWGPQVEQGTYKNTQRLYFSEQTDGRDPNTLVIATVEVVKARVAAAQNISQFSEETRSPFIKKHKTIIHPGEVNRIRELPQNNKIVATHTDSPNVLICDVENQSNRQPVVGAKLSRPDLTLTGHRDNAEFALAMCPVEPFVLSGGKDKCVVLWSINDHISSLASSRRSQLFSDSKDGAVSGGSLYGSTVQARVISKGTRTLLKMFSLIHQGSNAIAQEFCSVGDDACLILWDARTGSSPIAKVEKAHNADIHSVDWNSSNVNFILTGSADKNVHMYDRRRLTSRRVGSPVHVFKGHRGAVLCVQLSPDNASVFGSAAEDGVLNIWDHKKIGTSEGSSRTGDNPPGLFFRHAGHRGKVVDFHWNAAHPWTIVSASDDAREPGKGWSLQIWRMLDLLYRSEEDVISELDKMRSHVRSCRRS